MKHIYTFLFSSRLSGILLLLFAIAMATATFIENDYSTETAKALVYNAQWFEILLLLLVINFIGNITKYKLFSLAKLPVFLFHIAFIIIILGAGITRYRGYEALITIQEGESNNRMISIDTYLQVIAQQPSWNKQHISSPILMSELGLNSIDEHIDIDTTSIDVKLKKYIPRAAYKLTDSVHGHTYLHIVVAADKERKDFYIKKGTRETIFGTTIAFDTATRQKNEVFITQKEANWHASFPEITDYFSMLQNRASSYPKDSLVPLQFRALSQLNDTPFVFNEVVENQHLDVISLPKDNTKKNPECAVVLTVTSGSSSKEITLFGGPGYMNPFRTLYINGMHLKLRYGAKPIQLPFQIFLKDFVLERYPGSDSPSAFYSHLEIEDTHQLYDYTIFMNNVLNHHGFRFFQSAYTPDEKGTILSVNHDYWGTLVTYIGYAVLALGMLTSLCWQTSYFSLLLKKSH